MPTKKKTSKPVEPVESIVPIKPAPTSASITPADYSAQSDPTLPKPLTPNDERTWGMLAHLSTLLNLLTGLGGPIAALVIYLVYKDRSRSIAYHALQAMIFQLIWWFGGGILIGLMWAMVGLLSAILIGVVLIPPALLLTPILLCMPIVAIVYGIVGAVKVNQGKDFKYWLVGDWMRSTLSPE